PSLVNTDPATGAQRSTALVFGDDYPADVPSSARLIVAASVLPADDERIDVLLPMAHPYERQGSITNLEGRVQRQEGGAAPPMHARADWSIVAALAACLGVPAPRSLEAIRADFTQQHSAHRELLTAEALIARV